MISWQLPELKVLFRQRFTRCLKRAEIYSKAGADAILIHSKENFRKFFHLQKNLESKHYIPLVSVPQHTPKFMKKI